MLHVVEIVFFCGLEEKAFFFMGFIFRVFFFKLFNCKLNGKFVVKIHSKFTVEKCPLWLPEIHFKNIMGWQSAYLTNNHAK